MDDIVLRIRNLIENETRSCSMDFGCITPLYVYRMLGGTVNIEKIEQVMSNIKMDDVKWRTNVRISYNIDKSVMEQLV